MKTIGLIGGMSFESTAVYYRMINEMVRERIGGLASADVLLHSVNFAEIVALQKAGRWDLAAAALTESARRLQDAGADCILICTNTMHLVAPEVANGIDVPLIHIIDEARRRGYERLSLETGSMDAFIPARRLYESFGFTLCGPFGNYVDDPNSMFMTREL